MKKKLKQLLALVLTLAVVMGFALPTAAADPGPRVTIEKVSNDAVTAEPEMHTAETKEDTPQYADTDMVRVSITLAGASTVDAGYATRSIANNAAADIYRTGLKVQQQAMAQRISQDVLGGEALDVVWNMTLLTNTISANVPYGKIGAIEALDGVASVTLENRYEPDVVSTGDADPDMATSGAMIGSTAPMRASSISPASSRSRSTMWTRTSTSRTIMTNRVSTAPTSPVSPRRTAMSPTARAAMKRRSIPCLCRALHPMPSSSR